MQFKGEEKLLGEIPDGAPVELSDEVRLNTLCLYKRPLQYDALGGYVMETAGRLGVKEGPNSVCIYNNGKFIGTAQTKYGAKLLDKKAKVLTGTMGKKLIKLYEEGAAARFAENGVFNPTIKSGADPELFVENADGTIIPAWEFLPKKGEDVPAFWDGFQAECRPVPYGCLAYFVDNVRTGMIDILNAARKKFPKAKLSPKSTIYVPQDVLRGLPKEFVNFGCEPSLNAYGAPWEPIQDPAAYEMRTAGGHYHMGIYMANLSTRAPELVQGLDAIAGVASVAIFEGLEDPKRRELYGKAGEYRLPTHGLEYRVLSNAWLRHPAAAHLQLELCRMALRVAYNGGMKYWLTTPNEVQECINTSNVPMARAIFKRNEEFFKKFMDRQFGVYKAGSPLNHSGDMVMRVINKGIAEFMKDPDDIHGNWNLDKGSWATHSSNENAQWARAAQSILQGTKI